MRRAYVVKRRGGATAHCITHPDPDYWKSDLLPSVDAAYAWLDDHVAIEHALTKEEDA